MKDAEIMKERNFTIKGSHARQETVPLVQFSEYLPKINHEESIVPALRDNWKQIEKDFSRIDLALCYSYNNS